MADPARNTLPLPDYDHLPIGGLESRIRSLGAEEVEELLAYERSHADRLPATELLTARLEQLRSGAQPSSGDPGAVRPEQGQGRTGSPRVALDLTAAVLPAAARYAGPAGQAEG